MLRRKMYSFILIAVIMQLFSRVTIAFTHETALRRGLHSKMSKDRGISLRRSWHSSRVMSLHSTAQRNQQLPPPQYTVRTNTRTVEKFGELLSDLREILLTPGMTRVGVIRSIQVTRALTRLSASYARQRGQFLNEKGRVSVPKVLRRLFEELGATYIKLGQFIASSPTLFPAEYVNEFQACLDRTPTIPYSEVRKIIQDDLKRPVGSVYSHIDPVPIASASIAQVHRAILKDGVTEVAVKVRKPGTDSTLKADLGFLLIATKVIEFINPSLSSLSLSNIVSDIRESMLDELDFRKEAKNLDNFRSFLVQNNLTADATAPQPYPEYSGTKVLTMQFLKGVPLVDLEYIKKFAKSPETTLVSALRTWALSVGVNDVFHADVHAGNLMVLEDGRVGFIDFGIVGRISNDFRNAIGDMFNALVADDFQGVASALVRMGATGADVDTVKFGNELEAVIRRIMSLQPEITIATDEYGQAIDARLDVDERETTQLVLEIVTVAENNGLKLPREFGLVLKQALYFDRYQKILAPSMDPLRNAEVRKSMGSDVFRPPPSSRGVSGDVIDVQAVEED